MKFIISANNKRQLLKDVKPGNGFRVTGTVSSPGVCGERNRFFIRLPNRISGSKFLLPSYHQQLTVEDPDLVHGLDDAGEIHTWDNGDDLIVEEYELTIKWERI